MSPSQRATFGAELPSPPLRSESYSARRAPSMARSAPPSDRPMPSASSPPRISRQRRRRSSEESALLSAGSVMRRTSPAGERLGEGKAQIAAAADLSLPLAGEVPVDLRGRGEKGPVGQ